MRGISLVFYKTPLYQILFFQQKRLSHGKLFKKKRTKSDNKPGPPVTDKALENFDLYYRPAYGDLWPSIRIALLTTRKSAVVLNNFTEQNDFEQELISKGAYNIIQKAIQRQKEMPINLNDTEDSKRTLLHRPTRPVTETKINADISDTIPEYVESLPMFEMDIDPDTGLPARSSRPQTLHTEDEDPQQDQDTIETSLDMDRTNLFEFMPAKTVHSQHDLLRMKESEKSQFIPSVNSEIDILQPTSRVSLPEQLNVLAYPMGDVTNFSKPKSHRLGGHLGSYLCDAASILPVIALDLEDGDSVLDLCAAPGGKSLGILQTGLPGSLTCNDLSGSRITRLESVLDQYIPDDRRDHVTVTRKSGMAFREPLYDKVLVDVPCNSDRLMLSEKDNNIFGYGRMKDRLELPALQKDLLLCGIRSCRPGGSVVYCTSTLSAAQNDGIIQQTFTDVWRHSNIDIIVEDLSEMAAIFRDTFRFYTDCQYGQLVVPALSANYGPMYFCKIKRIS